MTTGTLGMFAALAGLVAVVALLAFGFIAIIRFSRRADRLAGNRAFAYAKAAAQKASGIGVGIDKIRSAGARASSLSERIAELALASSALAADIRLVEKTVEDLLEAIIPSARGSFAD
jgi:hypothetical protein